MIKAVENVESWYIRDSERNINNPVDNIIASDVSGPEWLT
jgi:hypothetical protein